MKLHPWLEGGAKSSPVLTDVAEYICLAWKGGKILDAGCGNGDLLAMLNASVPAENLCGCDIEPGHVEIARHRTGLPIEVSDVTRDDRFYGLSFSIIACIGWLHNCWPAVYGGGAPDPDYLRRFVERLQVLLEPGGLLIYDWPNESRQRRSELVDCLNQAGFRQIGILSNGAYVVGR